MDTHILAPWLVRGLCADLQLLRLVAGRLGRYCMLGTLNKEGVQEGDKFVGPRMVCCCRLRGCYKSCKDSSIRSQPALSPLRSGLRRPRPALRLRPETWIHCAKGRVALQGCAEVTARRP